MLPPVRPPTLAMPDAPGPIAAPTRRTPGAVLGYGNGGSFPRARKPRQCPYKARCLWAAASAWEWAIVELFDSIDRSQCPSGQRPRRAHSGRAIVRMGHRNPSQELVPNQGQKNCQCQITPIPDCQNTMNGNHVRIGDLIGGLQGHESHGVISSFGKTAYNLPVDKFS